MKKKVQLNIFDTNLVWKGVIDDVTTMVHRQSWHEIVNSELTISRTASGAEELVKGRIIVVNNDLKNGLIIEEMQTNESDTFWNINLIPFKGMLNYRICHPSDSGTFTGRTQSEVMMLLASNNLITQYRDVDRKFWNEDQTKLLFTVASLKAYGDSIDFSVDWGTGYLGETIVDIANMYDDSTAGHYPIGWNVYLKETLDAFEMDCYLPTNRSIRQNLLPPVVFSKEFNNISDSTYVNSLKDWHNVAYVKWNDGTTDIVSAVASVKHGRATSFLRKEIILDSSKKNVNEVVSEGRSEINKRPNVENFSADLLFNPNTMTTYGEDWFLGDIVTIQSKSIIEDELISLDTQIVEIEEIYDNGEYSINATFGEGKLSIIKKIKQYIQERK